MKNPSLSPHSIIQPFTPQNMRELASHLICAACIIHLTPHSIHHAPQAIYAHAWTMGCAICALHTHVCNPCPLRLCCSPHPSLHPPCAPAFAPSPHVVIRHQSLAILVHGHIHLVTFRYTPHARMHARSYTHLPTHKDPDMPHAHVPLPSLTHMQSSTQHMDTARQGGGGACYPPHQGSSSNRYPCS